MNTEALLGRMDEEWNLSRKRYCLERIMFWNKHKHRAFRLYLADEIIIENCR